MKDNLTKEDLITYIKEMQGEFRIFIDETGETPFSNSGKFSPFCECVCGGHVAYEKNIGRNRSIIYNFRSILKYIKLKHGVESRLYKILSNLNYVHFNLESHYILSRIGNEKLNKDAILDLLENDYTIESSSIQNLSNILNNRLFVYSNI